MMPILMLAALVFALYILVKRRKKMIIEELKGYILKVDKDEIHYSELEGFCSTNKISDDVYHDVRKNLYAELAEKNDIHALKMCAAYAKDKATQMKYTTRAAELGDVDSMYTLGLRYCRHANEADSNFGIGYDPQKSLYWYRCAAERGHGKSMAQIASCYQNGEGVPQDDEKAFSYAKDCAERGFSECTLFLADYYSFPFPEKPHIPKAQLVPLIERIMQRGDRETFAEAASKLGYIFGSAYLHNGERDEFSDRRKAAYCFTLAYVLDRDRYSKDNIFKTGYNPSQFELNKWQEDAINLRYMPM